MATMRRSETKDRHNELSAGRGRGAVANGGEDGVGGIAVAAFEVASVFM
jgi:hypothetical protein